MLISSCLRPFIRISYTTRAYAQLKKLKTVTESIDPNTIPEATLPVGFALRVAQSLAVGYPDRQLSLNIQCKASDASVRDLRGSVILPHRFLDTRVCVLSTDSEKLEIAKECGAKIVGGEELIPMIRDDKIEMDRLIVTPEILPLINPLARILGPKGIMPTVKKGTVTNDIKQAFANQADAILFKCDHNSMISCVVGKNKMKNTELSENIQTFLTELKELKKGKREKFVTHVWIQMEEGPAVYLDKKEFSL